MSIELEFNSVVIQEKDLQEIYPNLISQIQSFLPLQQTPKRRKRRRKKIKVSSLIDEIIADINTK